MNGRLEQHEQYESEDMKREEFESLMFNTLRWFEYRKCLRLFGGEMKSKQMPRLSAAIVILWFISFAVASVSIKANKISIEFEPLGPDNLDTGVFAVGIGINLIVLILLCIGINWGVGIIVELDFFVMLANTIVVLVIRGINDLTKETKLGIVITSYLAATLISDITVYYLWTCYLLPAIVKWKWQNQNSSSEGSIGGGKNMFPVSFPFLKLLATLVVFLVLIPLWIPIALSFVLYVLLGMVGAPIPRAIVEFLVLSKNSYNLTLKKRQRTGLNQWEISFEYAVKGSTNLRFFFSKPNTFTYIGQLDNKGMVPMGEGKWTDSELGGEVLVGCWLNGFPCAPYSSQEQKDNGGAFAASLVLFCDINASPPSHKSSNLDFKPAAWGLLSVEACMSGSWYSNFPDAKHVTSEKTLSGAFEKWLAISCHKSDASNKANGELLEAVVFVPGFNNYLKQGSETFGQLLALSSWPKHLVPFQFNWPGGSLLSYIAAQEVAASEQLATAFEGFLNEVHALPNVSRVHIIAHSMGCRFVLVGRCTHA